MLSAVAPRFEHLEVRAQMNLDLFQQLNHLSLKFSVKGCVLGSPKFSSFRPSASILESNRIPLE